MTDETNHDELQRLRDHNRELLAELKQARGELTASTQAVAAAQQLRDDWKARWYTKVVEAPLEAELRQSAIGPWKYLRDTVLELGLLKMEVNEEDVEVPVWYQENGKPADLSRGVQGFLSDYCHRNKGTDLDRCVVATRANGGGASGIYAASSYAPQKPTEAHKQPPPPLGLR